MAIESASVNYLAMLVAAVAAFVVGFLWYSPGLFGKQWMKLSGMTKKDMKGTSMVRSMIIGFLATVLMSFVLSYFIDFASAVGFVEGLQIGFWAWAGFLVPVTLGPFLWQGKPLKLFWINTLHWLVVLLLMGGILAAWV